MTTEFTVVIAGGGVAALESALALRALAGDRVGLRLLAPNADFVYRPLTVCEPFGYAPARRHPLAAIAADIDADLVVDELERVDAARRTVHMASGATHTYDALILAIGAQPRAPFAHATTLDDRCLNELLGGIVRDVAGGSVRSLAFVAPARMGWPLPLYELALMTAHRGVTAPTPVAITVVTPEAAPLSIFGPWVSDAVGQLLRDAGIAHVSSADVTVPRSGHIMISRGGPTIDVDRAIALPELFGPSVEGLPVAEHGFIPIDRYGQVRGVERVFAAGDATDYPAKHGGVGAQQADAAARSVAALAGAAVTPRPFDPEIRAMLLTGGHPVYLTARIAGSQRLAGTITSQPTWAGGAKIAATHLAPYLERRDRGHVEPA